MIEDEHLIYHAAAEHQEGGRGNLEAIRLSFSVDGPILNSTV